MYWAFNADDFIGIADMPDAGAAAAHSLTVGAGGAVSITTSALHPAAEVDEGNEVVHRRVDYRPPGA